MIGNTINETEMNISTEGLENVKSRSMWQDARIRFLKNKAAVLSLFVLGAILLFAIFGGVFAQYSNDEIDWSMLGSVKELGAPSIENGHYFGVDNLGRDLYSRLIQATRVSLAVGFFGGLIASIIGTAIGSIAGYFGGKADILIMRSVDILLAIPTMIVYIVLLTIIGRSTLNVVLIIGFFSWISMTLVVRGQALTLKNREFVDAARLMGLSNAQIIRRHIIPNLIGIVVIYSSLLIPELIMAESLLSFLGLGVQEPNTSWGVLISEGAQTMQYGTLWQLFIPFTFFALAQVSLYYIGDGLRDAFDPKDR